MELCLMTKWRSVKNEASAFWGLIKLLLCRRSSTSLILRGQSAVVERQLSNEDDVVGLHDVPL